MDELTTLRCQKWLNACKGPSQRATIARYLMSGESITQLQALNLFGCMRLAPRVFELINNFEMPIYSAMVERIRNGKVKRFARYYIANETYLQIYKQFIEELNN